MRPDGPEITSDEERDRLNEVASAHAYREYSQQLERNIAALRSEHDRVLMDLRAAMLVIRLLARES